MTFHVGLFVIVTLCMVCGPAFGQTGQRQAPQQQQQQQQQTGQRFDDAAVAQAEIALLRRTVEQQRVEIEALKKQVESLQTELREAGIEPGSDAALKEPKRLVYLLATTNPDAMVEISRAVQQLDETQWFNVVVPEKKGPVMFQPRLVRATPDLKLRLAEFLRADHALGTDQLSAVQESLRWRPDVVHYLGADAPADVDAFVTGVRVANTGIKARFVTTTKYCRTNKAMEMMARLAQETGGQCLDENGEPVVLP